MVKTILITIGIWHHEIILYLSQYSKGYRNYFSKDLSTVDICIEQHLMVGMM